MSESRLIKALRAARCYPHAVTEVRVVETHISWLLLTGEYAYKIKKPVDLGFLDFSTLDKRRHFCQEELRLNRRFSPELYVSVAPIVGSVDEPQMGGGGQPFEYAVQMRQFDPEGRLDRVLQAGDLSAAHVDQLAVAIHAAHATADVDRDRTAFGSADVVAARVADNLRIAREHLPEASRATLDALAAWHGAAAERLRSVFDARKASGFVRECHGDLHLENMVLIGGETRLFDCLEFNDELRWIDVMSDLAFAAMDLDDRGRGDLGRRLVNRYLELSVDYGGLAVLPYYQIYRALVRAAVAGIRAEQETKPEDQRRWHEQAAGYLRLAEGYTRPARPILILTHGVSGVGKSTVTEALVERLGAVRLRSDLVRRELIDHGADIDATNTPSHSAFPASCDSGGFISRAESNERSRAERYSAASRRRVYERMAEVARTTLRAGYSVLADATFLRRADRELFRRLADEERVPLALLRCSASRETVEKRVRERMRLGQAAPSPRPSPGESNAETPASQPDPSEATLDVLAAQYDELEPLADEELPATIEVDLETKLDVDRLVRRIDLRRPRAAAPGNAD